MIIPETEFRMWQNFKSILKAVSINGSYQRKIKKYSKGVTRWELINTAIKERGYQTYLEIGVRNPEDCFNRIVAKNKISVDPGLEFKINPVDFNLTSDGFFDQLSQGKIANVPKSFDVIFIDGLHRAEQVWRDIQNSLVYLSPGGIIFLHDCLPPDELFARESYNWLYQTGYCWNGTTWKAFARYLVEGEFDAFVVDTDWGVAVIDSSRASERNKLELKNEFFEFDVYLKYLEKLKLNITPEWALSRLSEVGTFHQIVTETKKSSFV